MAAKDCLGPQCDEQVKLYHGTGGAIEGGIVRPTDNGDVTGAFATNAPEYAEAFAKFAARDEGRLFGTLYEVEPLSKLENRINLDMGKPEGEDYQVMDTQGLKVKGLTKFVLRDDLDPPLEFDADDDAM